MSEFDFESRPSGRRREPRGYHPFTWGCGLYLGITFACLTCIIVTCLVCFGLPSLAMLGTVKVKSEERAKLLKEASATLGEPDLQKKRARLVDKLKQRDVFAKVDGQVVVVGSGWSSCSLEEKRAFASVLYAYIFDTKERESLRRDDKRVMLIKDDYDIEIGRYGGLTGGLMLRE